jgi:hypothetical protein
MNHPQRTIALYILGISILSLGILFSTNPIQKEIYRTEFKQSENSSINSSLQIESPIQQPTPGSMTSSNDRNATEQKKQKNNGQQQSTTQHNPIKKESISAVNNENSEEETFIDIDKDLKDLESEERFIDLDFEAKRSTRQVATSYPENTPSGRLMESQKSRTTGHHSCMGTFCFTNKTNKDISKLIIKRKSTGIISGTISVTRGDTSCIYELPEGAYVLTCSYLGSYSGNHGTTLSTPPRELFLGCDSTQKVNIQGTL